MGMSARAMRPTRKGPTHIVDIQWDAMAGTLRLWAGGWPMNHNADTSTIASYLHSYYGGNPTVVDNGSDGVNHFAYRVWFHDRLRKEVVLEDIDLYTSTPVTPTVTTIADGVSPVPGANETFYVSSSGTGRVSFSNGTRSGTVDFVDGAATAAELDGFDTSGIGSSTVFFTALTQQAMANFALTGDETGAAIVITWAEGLNPVAAVQEVQVVDLVGATHGACTINASTSVTIPAMVEASYVEAAIEGNFLGGCSVTGDAGGPFTLTFDEPAPRPEFFVIQNSLEIRTSTASSLQVTLVREGGA